MKILISIKDLLSSLFPELAGSDEKTIIDSLIQYYTVDGIIPQVSISDGIVLIEIPEYDSTPEEEKWNKLISLCEKGSFASAKSMLNDLLSTNPTNSEYNRLMGQILSEEGDQDGAIDFLIEAVRWNTQNKWAYLMLGNIFTKYYNDIDSALKHYNQVLSIDPNDYITLNNIAGALAKENKFEDATKYFLKALDINSEYTNSYIGLATIKEKQGLLKDSFEYLNKAIRTKNVSQSGHYQQLLEHTANIAEKATTYEERELEVTNYISRIEREYGRKIVIKYDEAISTLAKLEIAENYDRNEDIILYKVKDSSITTHLIMHEIVHLEYISEARKENLNKLFTTNQNQRDLFMARMSPSLNKLSQKGFDQATIKHLGDMLFDGLALLIYNVPIDLFIEDQIFNTHPSLKPSQFTSLYKMVKDGIDSVTRPDIIDLMPPKVISISRIYNLTQAFLFKDLYGVDLTSSLKATKAEFVEANKLWQEFIEYRYDRQAGEEYELIEHWAEDLNVADLFSLIEDKVQTSTNDPISEVETMFDKLIQTTQQDSLDRFYKEKEELGIDVEIIDFIAKAIKEFKNKDFDYIKTIAFEIATVGMGGISPNKDGYKISSFPTREFSGKEFLAYYYVSFKLTHPEIMKELGLPYDVEYDSAQDLLNLGLV